MSDVKTFNLVAHVEYVSYDWPRAYEITLYQESLGLSGKPLKIGQYTNHKHAFTKNGAIRVAKRGASYWARNMLYEAKTNSKRKEKSFKINLTVQIDGNKVKVT